MWLWAMAIGCSGDGETGDSGETTDPQGACGDVTEIDVTISGRVVNDDGAGIPDANVQLEERNWSPGTVHGEATTDGSGSFSMTARALPVVEGCWGTAVQFWLVGEAQDLVGEKPMNPQIIGAFDDGSLSVDLGPFPLVLR
ncbi:MAG: carboxypeptidase-like regulatory domain-containing protein [Myxococcota bacterium]